MSKSVNSTNRSCDHPTCVNPDHLWLGTPQTNMDDMIAKGRQVIARGEDLPGAILTDNIVRELRKRFDAKVPQFIIAKEFGVSRGVVNDVVRYKTWKHVEKESE